MTGGAAVDLVINAYERTYRELLRPGVFSGVAEMNRYPFARKVALINNVDDARDAARRAQALVDSGELDAWHPVADLLPHALEVTGLRRAHLGRLLHYSDAPLAAITMPGPEWLLYWDASLSLVEPRDWITPSLRLMDEDARVLVANPNWRDPTLERETIEREGEFALGLGFSDQVFLVRRSDLAAPVYSERCVASLRYPLAHVGHVFEARLDSHMRHHGRVRATYVDATYAHPPETAGLSYPDLTSADRLRWYRNRTALELISRSPLKRACWRQI